MALTAKDHIRLLLEAGSSPDAQTCKRSDEILVHVRELLGESSAPAQLLEGEGVAWGLFDDEDVPQPFTPEELPQLWARLYATLGLNAPWSVIDLRYLAPERRFEVTVEYGSSEAPACPVCGAPDVRLLSSQRQVWIRNNLLQSTVYIVVRPPRMHCPSGCTIPPPVMPWAEPGSGFLRMF